MRRRFRRLRGSSSAVCGRSGRLDACRRHGRCCGRRWRQRLLWRCLTRRLPRSPALRLRRGSCCAHRRRGRRGRSGLRSALRRRRRCHSGCSRRRRRRNRRGKQVRQRRYQVEQRTQRRISGRCSARRASQRHRGRSNICGGGASRSRRRASRSGAALAAQRLAVARAAHVLLVLRRRLDAKHAAQLAEAPCRRFCLLGREPPRRAGGATLCRCRLGLRLPKQRRRRSVRRSLAGGTRRRCSSRDGR